MKATRQDITLTTPTYDTPTGPSNTIKVGALVFNHLAYHRTVVRYGRNVRLAAEGAWTVTHLASGLAIRTQLRTSTQARALAIAVECDKTIDWGAITADEDGNWGRYGTSMHAVQRLGSRVRTHLEALGLGK